MFVTYPNQPPVKNADITGIVTRNSNDSAKIRFELVDKTYVEWSFMTIEERNKALSSLVY